MIQSSILKVQFLWLALLSFLRLSGATRLVYHRLSSLSSTFSFFEILFLLEFLLLLLPNLLSLRKHSHESGDGTCCPSGSWKPVDLRRLAGDFPVETWVFQGFCAASSAARGL